MKRPLATRKELPNFWLLICVVKFLLMRYSYVLHFPPDHPSFADMTHRWHTFLGEFAKPIADKYPGLLFWCSFYGGYARFRVHTENEETHAFIIQKIADTGLIFNSAEELDHTLSGDLGAPRFIDPALGADAIQRRADLILMFLCSTVRLVVDGLVKHDDLHWQYRTTQHNENPLGNNFESLVHLVGNISQVEFDVYATAGTAWRQTQLPATLRCRLW